MVMMLTLILLLIFALVVLTGGELDGVVDNLNKVVGAIYPKFLASSSAGVS